MILCINIQKIYIIVFSFLYFIYCIVLYHMFWMCVYISYIVNFFYYYFSISEASDYIIGSQGVNKTIFCTHFYGHILFYFYERKENMNEQL